MASQIKTVTDASQFDMIFSNFFTKNDVFIKTKNGDIAVHFLGYRDGEAAFRLPKVKNIPDQVIAFVRHNTNTIYCNLKYLEQSEDTFTFSPDKFQIIGAERREDRKLMDVGGGKSIIYMENVISDYYAKSALELATKQYDHIRDIVAFELEKQFNYARIMFIHEAKNDPRMRHFIASPNSIFIPDLNTDPPPGREHDYQYYLKEIYARDFQLAGSNKYTSEVSIPLRHRELITYGFLQVNHTQPIQDGQFTAIKRMAVVIDHYLVKNNVFSPVPEKFLISDLSQSGCGIVFKDRKLTRYFRKDGTISFDLLLPTKKRASMGGLIRNVVFLENSVIKVGIEILSMNDQSRANYDEFLKMKPL